MTFYDTENNKLSGVKVNISFRQELKLRQEITTKLEAKPEGLIISNGLEQKVIQKQIQERNQSVKISKEYESIIQNQYGLKEDKQAEYQINAKSVVQEKIETKYKEQITQETTLSKTQLKENSSHDKNQQKLESSAQAKVSIQNKLDKARAEAPKLNKTQIIKHNKAK